MTTSFPVAKGDPSGHFVATEAKALSCLGHSVLVIAPRRESPPEGAATAGHSGCDGDSPCPELVMIDAGDAWGPPGALARLRASPLRVIGVVRFVLGSWRALRRRGPFDTVVAHWILPAAWPIAIRTNAKLEVVVHGSDARLLLRLPALLRRYLLRRLLCRGAHFRFVSFELLEQLVAAGPPELRARSTVSPPAFDLPDLPTRALARDRLGIEPTERLLVVIGRLVPSKRVATALAAASLLGEGRLVVVGEGPERESLQRDFPGVVFVGALPRQQALTWLRAADLLLSASREEGAPTTIREARRLEVPVVTTPAGDLERWAEGDPGLHVVRAHPPPQRGPGSPGGVASFR